MTIFKTTIKIENNSPREEDLIKQGDFIYCDAGQSGAISFWGIYVKDRVIALDGGGSDYIIGKLYLYQRYTHWVISYRVPCNKAIITIEEAK